MNKEEIMEKIIQKIRNGENIYSLMETESFSKTTIDTLLEEHKEHIFLEIKEFVKSEEYEKSLACLNNDVFKDDSRFQSIKAKVYRKQGNYDEALQICNRKEFQDNEFLQSQKVSIFMIQEKYKEALEICNRDIFNNTASIQSQKVSILIKFRKYKEALTICYREIFRDSEFLQSQKVTILITKGKYYKALKICDRNIFQNSPVLQFQKAQIYCLVGKEEEALEICSRDIFEDNEQLQFQRVKILMKKEKYEEALAICNREIFKNNRKFILRKKQLLELMMDKNIEQELTTLNDAIRNRESSPFAAKLYDNTLTLEDILTSNLDQWMQTIFLFAYFEKMKSKNALTYMKKWKSNLDLTEEQQKIWNQCMGRLQNKRNVYLQETYDLLIFGNPCEVCNEESVSDDNFNITRDQTCLARKK